LGPNEYKVLLVVAGLVTYKTGFGFVVKLTAWKNFFVGHRFTSYNYAIKFEQKKIELNAYINGTPPSQLERRRFYIVRIGNTTKQSPNKIEEQIGWDGQLATTPPRLNRLGIKSQSF
jgi:hypothetical protein